MWNAIIDPSRTAIDALRQATPGTVVTLTTWDPQRQVRTVHITAPLANQPLLHEQVNAGIFGRPEWVDGQLLVGELVFGHGQPPDWQTSPQDQADTGVQPVVIACCHKPPIVPCARMWWGNAGEDPLELMRQVKQLLMPESVPAP